MSQIYFAAKQPQFLNLDGRNFLTGSAAHCFCHSFHLPHLDVWKLTQQVAAQNDGEGENQTKQKNNQTKTTEKEFSRNLEYFFGNKMAGTLGNP